MAIALKFETFNIHRVGSTPHYYQHIGSKQQGIHTAIQHTANVRPVNNNQKITINLKWKDKYENMESSPAIIIP